MFEIDQSTLPVVRTRQALLLLDLQNDFLTTGGLLHVEEPPDFLENILSLLPHFRLSGNNVIWIRSQFEASRPVNGSGGESERIILDDQILPKHRRAGQKIRSPPQKLLDQHKRIAENNSLQDGISGGDLEADDDEVDDAGDENVIEESYLTIPTGSIPRVVVAASPGTNFAPPALAGFDGAEDLIFQKTFYSAFRDGALMEFMRAKFITEIFLCGSLTNISVFATAMDAARHGFAITVLDDCLGYRSRARHDEALKQLTVSTGCDIISSKELVSNLELKAKARSPRGLSRPPRRNKTADLDSLMAKMSLKNSNESDLTSNTIIDATSGNGHPTNRNVTTEDGVTSSESPKDSNEEIGPMMLPSTDGKKRERIPAKIKIRRRHSKSRSSDKGPAAEQETSGSQRRGVSPTSVRLNKASQALQRLPPRLEAEDDRQTHPEVTNVIEALIEAQDTAFAARLAPEHIEEGVERKGAEAESGSLKVENSHPKSFLESDSYNFEEDDSEKICEDDGTCVVKNLLDDEAVEGIFEKLREEVQWKTMSHQGGEVPRLVAVQGQIGGDESIPLYRHPADESPTLVTFSPTVSQIQAKVEEKLGHPVNHVLIQFYRSGTDYISEHSDKTLDIAPGTFIANVSLGAQRTMVFRTKKPLEVNSGENLEAAAPRESCRVVLPHNSMCKMGMVTNMRWLHGIRQDKRLQREKSIEELAFGGGRISLTFRSINTFMTKNEERIWGQGAVAKTKDKAKSVLNGKTAESEKMILAFGEENRSTEFDWQRAYGGGFDVLHISNPRKLFLSGDKICDLRVELHLSELQFDWVEGKVSPTYAFKNGQVTTTPAPVPKHIALKFVDNDPSFSVVVGDHSIMLYLECVYGHKDGKPPRADLARQFTRFDQSRVFLNRWRAVPYTVKPFLGEMRFWENVASEFEYIASPMISVVDFAIWPILDEVNREWPEFNKFPKLVAYYEKMKHRPSISSVMKARELEGRTEGTQVCAHHASILPFDT